MKSVLLIILCCVICSFAFIDKEKPKRKIKSEIVYNYSPPHDHSGKLPDTSIYYGRNVINYDTGGRPIAFTMYHTQPADNVFMSVAYEYDGRGREIQTKFGDKISSTKSYEVNSAGNLKITNFSDGRKQSVRIRNKMDNVDTVYLYDRSVNFMGKLVQKFSAQGDTITQDKFKANGAFENREIRIFDDQKRMVKEIILNNDNTRSSLETFAYRSAEEIRIDSNKMYIGGVIPGDKIADKVFSYTVRYDKVAKYGNWLQRSFLFNKKYFLLGKREIEYY